MVWAIGLALFILGIVFVIIYPINKKKNDRCSAQTEGTLLEIYRRFNSNGYTGDGYLYSYYVNGIEYQLKSTVRSEQVEQVSDSCTIWYNPEKPKEAQPFHYQSNKAYTVILLIGIAMMLLGIILIVAGAGR